MLPLGKEARHGLLSRLTIRAKTITASVMVLTCVLGMGLAVLLTSRQVAQNLNALSRSNLPTRAAAEAVSDAVFAVHMGVFRYVSWASNGVNGTLLQNLRHTIDSQFSLINGDFQALAARPDLSAADLFYCGGGDCSAGQDVEQALGYVTTKGIVPAYNIPYKPTGQTCGRGPADLELRVTKISGFINLRSRGSMQDAIQSRGPVIATLRAYQDLKNYKSGVYRYNGTAPFLYMQTVSVIGFTPDGWLCKNSWGPSWGTGGVFLIAYGECGIDDETMWEINGITATELRTELGTILTFERAGTSYVLAGAVGPSVVETVAKGL